MQSQLDLRMGQIVQSFYSSLLIAPDYGMHATWKKTVPGATPYMKRGAILLLMQNRRRVLICKYFPI